MLQRLLWVAIAGSLGALIRYFLTSYVQNMTHSSFPWGTFIVNMLGTLGFGIIWSVGEKYLFISGETRLIILAGFMGAFTTFSTFMFETGTFLRDGQWFMAFANLSLQFFAGLLCLFLGFTIGRLF